MPKRKSKPAKKTGPARSEGDDRAVAPLDLALEEFFVDVDSEPVEAGSGDIHLGLAEPVTIEAIHQYLSFRLADELYAVSILYIKEIIKPSLFTELPRTAAVVLGIISLRGMIVPVVDLRLLLGLDDLTQTRKSRILIVNTDQGDLVGLLVDEVRSVIRLRDEDIEPPPAVFGRTEAEHIKGVGWFDGEMYTLLELESVVQLERYIRSGVEGQAK